MIVKLHLIGLCFLGLLLSACSSTNKTKDAPNSPAMAAVLNSNMSSNLSSNVSTKTSRRPASHAWGNYHWARQTSPANLKLGNCLTNTNWMNYFLQASSDWNSPTTFGAISTPLLTVPVSCAPTKRCSLRPKREKL